MKSRRKNGVQRKMSLFIVGLMLISGVPGNVLAEELSADNTAIVQPASSAANNNLIEFKTTEQLNPEMPAQPDSEVLATSTVAGDYEYSAIDGGVSITKYTGSGGTVTIPATLDEKPVLKIDIRAFASCTSLTTVTIPAGVTSISFQAFSGCSNLTTITVPESVQSVGDQAFYNCSRLKSVSMPGVISVGDRAFYSCSGLSSISLPKAERMEDSAFSYCYGLTSIDLPNVTSIGNFSFSTCQLTSVNLPSIADIGEYAFNNCSNLTTITLSENTISIGRNAFSYCRKLSSITIPNGITSIASFTFANCESLASVTLPEGLTRIENNAFDQCYALTTINLPNSLTSIGNAAFNYCVKLPTIDLPKSLKNINNSAFANCISLTRIELPQGATTIGSGAFTNCESLTAVTIPDSVTAIGGEAFKESPKVTIYGGNGSAAQTYANNNSIPFIGSAAFTVSSFTSDKTSGQTVDTEILLTAAGADGTTPYEYKFYYQLGADTTTIQNFSTTATATFKPTVAGLYTLWVDVKDKAGKTASRSISDFEVLPAATADGFVTAVIEGGVGITRYIGNAAEVTIPATIGGEKVLEISDVAFANCISLTRIELPQGATTIGYHAFYNCESLTAVTIPDSVTDIGGEAFKESPKVTIYGVTGSPAQTYAAAHSISFIGSAAFTVSSFTTDKASGQTVDTEILLTAAGADGTTPYEYEFYYQLGADTTTIQNLSATASATFKPTVPGLYTLWVDIKDKAGKTVSRSISDFKVIPAATEEGFETAAIEGGVRITRYTGSGTEVAIPATLGGEKVLEIGDGAFSNCTSLATISLPEGLLRIGSWSFENCGSLNSISIPASVTSIGEEAFLACHNLNNIALPDSVSSLGNDAFLGTGITCLVIPAGMTSISSQLFGNNNNYYYRYNSLTSISLPKTITSINATAFDNCQSLTAINVAADNPNFSSHDGILFDKAGTTLVRCPKGLASVTLPADLAAVGNNAFAGCSQLTRLMIPESVTAIGESAFISCENLQSVNIPIVVKTINANTFSGCRRLNSISIPTGVISIGNGAFQSCENLITLSLPESIISIGDNAFSNCTKLNNVNLLEGVSSIGDSAFSNCTRLGSISLPKSLQSIGNYAFSYCTRMSDVILFEGITNIGSGAFYYCNGLSQLTLPDTIKTIGSNAFDSCTSLSSINIPKGLDIIEDSTFNNCTNLSSINIETSVRSIGNYAFARCTLLSTAVIPDTVTTISYGAFGNCPLINIYGTIGSYAQTYANNNSIPFIGSAFFTVSSFTADKTSGQTVDTEILLSAAGADGTTPYEYKFYYQLGADTTTIQNFSTTATATFKPTVAGLYTLWVEIKDGSGKTAARSISDFKVIPAATEEGFETAAIAGGVRITRYTGSGTEIAIPATLGGEKVLEIGDGAFSNCTGLATISLPEGLLRIGSWSFENCGSLNSISIPASVTSIGEAAFLYCNNLNSIALPDGVSSIGNDAFLGTGFISLVIPAGMTTISSQLLNGCYSLTSINLPKTITSIDAKAFDNCQSLTTINVAADNPNYSSHDGMLFDKAGTTLVRCPKNLANVTLPVDLVAIGHNAFAGCSQLISMTIPESVTAIGESAFVNCNNLQKVNIPAAVNIINANTFSGCNSLNSISIPTGVTSIGNGAFQSCENLVLISLPESVLSIGDNAFNNCLRLNTVNFTEGLSSIGNGSFSNCSRLGSISLPKSLLSIGDNTFSDCPKLSVVSSQEGITSIGFGAFRGCTSLISISLPDTITTMSGGTFSYCSSLNTIKLPDGVTTIGYNVFDGCQSLTAIIIPDNVTSLETWSFRSCPKLIKVIIPDTVTNISFRAFESCPLLTIYGARGSAAETYAKDNQIPFIADFNVQSFTADKASGQVVNTEIRLTAIGADGTAPYQYQFFYTQGGDATIIQPASLANTAIFKPSSAGTYTLGVEIQDDSGKTVSKSIADYKVITAPAAPPAGPSGPPAPPPAPEPTPDTNIDDQQAIADIGKAQAGASVAVPVKNDEPVPTSILETARGKDVNVVFEFENYSWSINGKSIDELSGATAAYDLSVKTFDDPALGELSGGDDVLQIEISHNGALPFVGQLTYQVDPALNGKTVYRYYYNEELKKLVYQDEAVVTDGKVSFSFEHASKYVITDTDTLAPPDITISYQTHVQNIGWQGFVKNGETSGTFAQSLRLEGIEITANGADNLGVQYKTHVENLGWQDFVSNGTASGTTGKSLRLEAIQINLTGTAAADYDIYYQVHAQNFGWLDWAKNGASAGTEGFGYRLEAIKIMVVPKDAAAPGKTEQAFVKK
ncbi:MAG: leucine-rich repeat protein [Acetobacterium sp.]|uniref:leucine-rich repeat protein n=1 Tax=Acetobacterium sp. TaxID=1872094 RepID=UPI00324273DC